MDIAAVILVLLGVLNLFRVLSRRNWTKTPGKLEVSRITPLPETELQIFYPKGHGGYLPGKVQRYKSGYLPKLIYSFTVDGERYLGNSYYSAQLWFLNVSKLRFLTEGAAHDVRYNPSNPNKSYLYGSSLWPSVVLIIIGLGIFNYQKLIELLSLCLDGGCM